MVRSRFWLGAISFFVACGGSTNDNDSTSGKPRGDASIGTPGTCGANGQSCTANGQCCSALCDPNTHACASSVGRCAAAGASCSASTDCCTLACDNGVCSSNTCVADNGACTSDGACCGGKCTNGTCQPLNGTCRTSGNACTSNGECCSKLCKNGKCDLGSSFCTQTGDVCSNPRDCCGGICTVAPGSTLGTCSVPTPGSTRCTGGVDGTICGGCGDCCSRVCVPYGTSGVSVCQRADGCHIDGDICAQDRDCCGNDQSLPTSGKNVQCVRENPGDLVGVCRNPMGCSPEGNVCHYKQDMRYACVVSSAPNNCCGATGNSDACKLDQLGVPRCGAGGCRQPGDTCAFSGNCCDGSPCVPDSTGQLRCRGVPDGGPPCVPTSGGCTINADCCAGNVCHTPPGSTSGTCRPPLPPPPPADDAGPPVPPPDGGVCAEYGQVCSSATPCCAPSVPCLGTGDILCNGQSVCHCRIPVK